MKTKFLSLHLLLAGVLLSACSSVKVKIRPAEVTQRGIQSSNTLEDVSASTDGELATLAKRSQVSLREAKRLEAKGNIRDAAGEYLKTALDAYQLLGSGTVATGSAEEQALMDIHNLSLARFLELWGTDPRRLDPGPYHLSAGNDDLEISLSPDSTYQRHYFDTYIAAESINEKGVERLSRKGLGAPMVGIRERHADRPESTKFFPMRGLHTPITVTVDSVARRQSDGVTTARFSIRNPMLEQSVKVGSRSYPIAADFSAPIAVVLRGRNQSALGLAGFFKARKRASLAGIYLTEPYDPNRIPVILIHGLVSVPMIWRDMIPEMMHDPEISRRYQFMVFGYPSGVPIADSALMLRECLAEMREFYDPDGNDPLSRNMVVVGHSMGGILTHTLVAEFGDSIWNQISDTPIDDLDIDPDLKEDIRKKVFFDPDPAVRRAVFYSAPHRGADMATKGIVGLVSKLAKLPVNVLSTTSRVIKSDVANKIDPKLKKLGTVTSAQSLQPGAPVVAALDEAPYKEGVIYHSIVGDRGKGDTPNSSDGVVDYWSSHQEGAASELIVPTGHSSYKHPKSIAELARILRLHAGLN